VTLETFSKAAGKNKREFMATLMDTSVLSGLSLLWPFLLTFCLIFGLLSSTKLLGEKNNGLNAIIAFVFGILVLFSDTVTKTINMSASWIVLFILFLVFMLLIFRFFGATEGQILSTITGPHRYITMWIILIIVIIFLGSLSSVLSDKGGVGKTHIDENGTVTSEAVSGDSQQSEFWRTIAHPKVLGALFLLIVATFAINRLTVSSK